MKKLEITRLPSVSYASTEAFNTLTTNLTFLGNDVKKIMVTSSRAGEGKSHVALNIIRTFSGIGKKVCFVDSDIRRSAIQINYGIKGNEKTVMGLSHYLAGLCDMKDVIYEANDIGAFFVPAGRLVSNSLPLLTTKRLPNLLDTLARDMDYVIVDAAPVGIIIDAAEIAKSCDGTLFVVQYNEIHRKELTEAKLQIEKTGCPILGAVLNNVEMSKYSNRKYYYWSQYSKYGEEYSTKLKGPSPARRKKRV